MTKGEKVKVYLYTRVSTSMQIDGISPNQKKADSRDARKKK